MNRPITLSIAAPTVSRIDVAMVTMPTTRPPTAFPALMPKAAKPPPNPSTGPTRLVIQSHRADSGPTMASTAGRTGAIARSKAPLNASHAIVRFSVLFMTHATAIPTPTMMAPMPVAIRAVRMMTDPMRNMAPRLRKPRPRPENMPVRNCPVVIEPD